MDKKFKRFAKTCKIFPKNKKSSKIKAKTLQKVGGGTSFADRIAVGQRQSHGQLEIRHVFGDTFFLRALPLHA